MSAKAIVLFFTCLTSMSLVPVSDACTDATCSPALAEDECVRITPNEWPYVNVNPNCLDGPEPPFPLPPLVSDDGERSSCVPADATTVPLSAIAPECEPVPMPALLEGTDGAMWVFLAGVTVEEV